jgi:hypothetical protein
MCKMKQIRNMYVCYVHAHQAAVAFGMVPLGMPWREMRAGRSLRRIYKKIYYWSNEREETTQNTTVTKSASYNKIKATT